MSEIIARIAPDKKIELTKDGRPIDGLEAISPYDAIYLARGLIACALAFDQPDTPQPGDIFADAHIPIRTWLVGTSKSTGYPALMIGFPNSVGMTFVMTEQGARELGQALVARGHGTAPPDGERGTVH